MDATTIFNKSEHSIKLMKMSKGYQWEIKVYGDDIDKILETIKDLNCKLQADYTDFSKI